jgi:malonyl-CoA decarboxylase
VTESKLVRLLEEIQSSTDPPLEVLDQFRALYRRCPRDARELFFSDLLSRMEVSRESVDAPLRAVRDASADDALLWTSRLTDLRRALESPRMRAFRRFLNASGGLKFLLDLRADILSAERQSGLDLGPLDEEIAYLFTSWFQYGFLFLQEITQDSSYRQIRFLKEHDMVHPMSSLEEMGNRLGGDRRSFALYHRAMPEEPIVFIEAALTRRIPSSIHEILDTAGESFELDPDTAIFYSINNAQNGLVGLGLGKLLIFQVVEAIKKDRPQIQTFATLSPVTGFWRRYLQPILEGRDEPFGLKRSALLERFPESSRRRILARRPGPDGDRAGGFALRLLEILSEPAWIEDEVLRRELERPLTRIAYYYLTEEKDAGGKPINPVASFHLGNGARLTAGNVHFAANRTERGLKDSCGVMVSYVYSSTWLHDLRRSAQAMLPWQS